MTRNPTPHRAAQYRANESARRERDNARRQNRAAKAFITGKTNRNEGDR